MPQEIRFGAVTVFSATGRQSYRGPDEKKIRAQHQALLKRGYAGGSCCHAVWLVTAAAEIVGVDLKTIQNAIQQGRKTEMYDFLMNMAKYKLSPKVITSCIPEYVELITGLAKLGCLRIVGSHTNSSGSN